MENWQYFVGAYSIAWLGLAYYVFKNIGRVRIVERKIADIEDKLKG